MSRKSKGEWNEEESKQGDCFFEGRIIDWDDKEEHEGYDYESEDGNLKW